MKFKKFALIFCFSVMSLFFMSTLHATPIFFNGDSNYPIWSSGNKMGACYDLSSSVLKEYDAIHIVIAAINMSCTYQYRNEQGQLCGPLGPADTYVLFGEDIYGRLYYCTVYDINEYRKWHMVTDSIAKEAYLLAKRKVLCIEQ